MPAPATTGQLRTKIEDMKIGDYISCNFHLETGWEVGWFSKLGSSTSPECPLTGIKNDAIRDVTFYLIKVAKGLLIADRVIHHTVSWDVLNKNRYIQGAPKSFFAFPGDTSFNNMQNVIVRSLTGGVAYADANGNKSLTDQGYGGWPTNNEWDKFIVGFPQELIQSGKTLDDVFHWNGVATWCQDTPMNNTKHPDGTTSAINTMRTWRGGSRFNNTIKQYGFAYSNISDANIGFRPVFEYIES